MEIDRSITQYRQVLYWRLLTSLFNCTQSGENFEQMSIGIVQELELPQLLLDPNISIENLLHRYPELESDFTQPILSKAISPEANPSETVLDQQESAVCNDTAPNHTAPNHTASNHTAPNHTASNHTATLRRALVFSKLLLNVFGPNTQTSVITAQHYAQWLKDVGYLERAMGCAPGTFQGRQAGSHPSGGGQSSRKSANKRGRGQGGKAASEAEGGTEDETGSGAGLGTGSGFTVTEEQLRRTLQALEGELVNRMALREVLKDDQLAGQLSPSMALVEQLLRDKANLSGTALKNAKRLIQQYINELAEVLRLQVAQTVSGKIDRSVPPKRVFRNLDLKRTLWKNLTNWNPDEERLYVDRLYYRHTAKKKTPTRLIVVVDQSGSMVDAMVQCTILASIFAGLPNVDVHLLAFDTQVLDLTPWVSDPFEVLLRTQLGGGTHIYGALVEAAQKILEPTQTGLVLISDFYEGGSHQVLFDYIKSLKDSGVHFIPVGSVSSSGYFSVDQWFRDRLKELGTPILTGSPQKLIQELRKIIVS